MKQPVEPNKEDCCNSGCNPCIFDIYEKQLKLYRKYFENGEKFQEPTENGISQLEYTPFFFITSVELCDLHKILVFKNLHINKDKNVWWKPGNYFLLKYSSGDTTCTRAYTPLKLKFEHSKDSDFSIIVKRYNTGLVSNYLFNLNEGDMTLWRGPYGSYEITPNKFSRIIMICQGTGVAPFFSIIENILNNEDDMTRVILFYCCQSLDNILLREELYSFKSYWNFSYKVYLSQVSSDNNYKYQEPIEHQKLSFIDITELKLSLSKDQFLLCGSLEFMNVYKTLLCKENILPENIILF